MVAKIVDLAEKLNLALARVRKLEEGGGYLYVLVSDIGASEPPPPTVIARIGRMPPEKAEGRYRKAEEKALRLFRRKADKSSWQSRNPEAHQWGGAVRLLVEGADGVVKDVIISFSGHPEAWDEVLTLAIASLVNWNYQGNLRDIAHETVWPCLLELLDSGIV